MGGLPHGGAMATRSKSSQRWLKEHFSDPYVKKAQAEGMRSRAAYKLEELVDMVDAVMKEYNLLPSPNQEDD